MSHGLPVGGVVVGVSGVGCDVGLSTGAGGTCCEDAGFTGTGVLAGIRGTSLGDAGAGGNSGLSGAGAGTGSAGGGPGSLPGTTFAGELAGICCAAVGVGVAALTTAAVTQTAAINPTATSASRITASACPLPHVPWQSPLARWPDPRSGSYAAGTAARIRRVWTPRT
jgi:hypothetical protein